MNRRCWIATLTAIGFAGMVSCRTAQREAAAPSRALADTARARVADTSVRIALEPYLGRLRSVRVRAAGRDWNLLFDTGGGFTLLSPDLARALGCDARGRILGHRMSGETFSAPACTAGGLGVQGWNVPAQTIGVFDLMRLLPAGWPRIDGLVSLRSFAGERVTLDLRGNALVVHGRGQRAHAPAGDAIPLPGRVATGPSGGEVLPFVGVAVAGDTLWLEIDSGNLDAVLLAPHAARMLGMPDTVAAARPALSLPLVPGRETTVHAVVRGLIFDGALNAAWLEQGRLTMDLADGRLWWAPHAGPAGR